MPNAKRIPVKMSGVQVGFATISDDGSINLTMESPSTLGRELLEHIKLGIVFGLTINPIVNPGIDGKLLTRVRHERPLPDFGGLNIDLSDRLDGGNAQT